MLQRRAIGNMLLAGALQRRICVEEVAAPRKPMRHQRKSLLLPLRSTAWHHREAHASREKHCEQGEALRAGRSNAGREKHCGQGEAVRARRSNASREKQCGQGELLRAGPRNGSLGQGNRWEGPSKDIRLQEKRCGASRTPSVVYFYTLFFLIGRVMPVDYALRLERKSLGGPWLLGVSKAGR